MEEEYNSTTTAAASLRSAPISVATTNSKPSSQHQQITTDNHFYHSAPSKQFPSIDIANNNNNISYKDQPLIGSPQLSSNSSVASSHDDQRNNNNEDDELDNLNHQHNHSPPSSPQSSYNSSFGSNSGRRLINNSSTSITSLVPGGVVTTQNISTVIKPKSNNNSLQFVKIQTPELSKKAVEQIRVAEESKISRDKIKEVEEEWQNNLLNWKSKRRQQFSHTVADHDPNNSPFESNDNLGGRKIKTFAEMIEERAKSGNRLGFHLQRYIGADDDDEEEAHHIASATEVDEPKQFEQTKPNSGELKNDKLDSDCEANSSTTSSGYNQPNSKSPDDLNLVDSPKVGSPVSEQRLTEDDYNDRLENIRCDRNSSRDMVDNSHSISVLGYAELDPFNSTLKQGIKMPQVSSMTAGKETKAADKKPGILSSQATRNDKLIDNNSIFEEDEEEDQDEDDQEEEEEQKHLQRIAFEAKLKAFEKLTKPTIETPKFIPKRIVKPPIFNQMSTLKPVAAMTPKPAPKLVSKPSPLPTPSNNSSRQVSITSIRQSSPSPPLPPPIITRKPSPPTATSVPIIMKKPASPPPSPSSPPPSSPPPSSPPPPSVQAIVNKLIPTPQAPVVPIVNKPAPAPSSPEPLTKSNSSIQSSSPMIAPTVVPKHSLPHSQPAPVSVLKTTPPSLRAPITTPKLAPQTPQGSAITPSSRKCSREDKDKTVLSVSGKKRCSSCKEELGRGAAAFVVESLSLVYHTNCFRCSVCHINLSNGFRGVDVRVHAGALHCQNCYSKDGLNYSRV